VAYQTVRELVEHVKGLHQRLRQAARASKAAEADERRSLLLGYIEEQEQEMHRALCGVETRADRAVLDTWLQFAPDAEVDGVIARLETGAPLPSFEDLIARILEAQDGFVEIYRIMQAETSAPRVRAFFASMMEMEVEGRKKYARVRLEARDR
jgi:hypothetical protein